MINGHQSLSINTLKVICEAHEHIQSNVLYVIFEAGFEPMCYEGAAHMAKTGSIDMIGKVLKKEKRNKHTRTGQSMLIDYLLNKSSRLGVSVNKMVCL